MDTAYIHQSHEAFHQAVHYRKKIKRLVFDPFLPGFSLALVLLITQSVFGQTYGKNLTLKFKSSFPRQILLPQSKHFTGSRPIVPRDTVEAKKGSPVTIGTTWTIHSNILNEDRRLLIHLPAGYAVSHRKYPVLYLLDGDSHFEHVTGIVDFLSRGPVPRIPQMIIVGITNTDRTRDLTPPTKNDTSRFKSPYLPKPVVNIFPTAGGADTFLRFLNGEVKPFLKDHFRVAPFSVLAGHSFGGLFVIHTLLKHPDSFNAYIAMSPSLQWNNEGTVTYAKTHLNKIPLKGKYLYLTAGDYEGMLLNKLDDFRAVLKLTHPEGLKWWYRITRDAEHNINPHLSMYYGLEAIFNDWRVSDALVYSGNIQGLASHFMKASGVYGYKILPPEWLLNQIGYMQLHIKRPKQALDAFAENVRLYPKSPNVYDSMVDVLMATGQFKEALKDENEAVKLGAEAQDPRLSIYQRKLDELQKKISKRE